MSNVMWGIEMSSEELHCCDHCGNSVCKCGEPCSEYDGEKMAEHGCECVEECMQNLVEKRTDARKTLRKAIDKLEMFYFEDKRLEFMPENELLGKVLTIFLEVFNE